MRLFFAIIIALSSAFTFTGGAEFSFLDTKHDFPDATEGEVLRHNFVFTNTGTAPLVIADYKVACSCTKIAFPAYPVMPGKSDTLKLTFETAGKYGFQSRKIEVYSNAKKTAKLSFRVFVNPTEN